MDSTPIFGLGIPSEDGSDGADLAALLRTLGLDVEGKAGGITAMTSAARAALTGAGKYEGRVVHETDTDTLWRSDGTTWRQLALLDSSGHLPMGGKKVTGLAAGAASTDAATKGQVDAAPPHAIGVRAGSQTLSTVGGWNTITYTSETDPGGALNPATGVFTCPTTGLWQVQGYANCSETAATTQSYILDILAAGATVAADSSGMDNLSLGHYMSCGAVVSLAAGDQVTLRVYNAAEATDTVTYARLGAVLLGT